MLEIKHKAFEANRDYFKTLDEILKDEADFHSHIIFNICGYECYIDDSEFKGSLDEYIIFGWAMHNIAHKEHLAYSWANPYKETMKLAYENNYDPNLLNGSFTDTVFEGKHVVVNLSNQYALRYQLLCLNKHLSKDMIESLSSKDIERLEDIKNWLGLNVNIKQFRYQIYDMLKYILGNENEIYINIMKELSD